MKKIKILAFDLDGTLVDSAPGIVSTVQRVLEDFGYPQPEEPVVMNLIGLPLRAVWQAFAPTAEPDWETYTLRYREHYRVIGIPAIQPFAGVRETLTALREHGYRLSIASSKITPVSRLVLEHLGMSDLFDLIMGDDSVNQPKPHPEMLLRTLEQLRSQPHEAVLIGDTTYDLGMGRGAGVQTVIIPSGTQPLEQIQQARPDYIIDRFSDLPNVLQMIETTVQ